MDIADQCQQQNELPEEANLYEVRRLLQAAPEPTGSCLWCAEPVPDRHRWCNATCRDDWQNAMNAARRIRK